MKSKLNFELKVTDESEQLIGKISAFNLEGLQEQMHKIEKVAEDNAYACDICGEYNNIKNLIEVSENRHICTDCNEAEPLPTQQDLE